jgi:hypothetical protein
MYTRGTLDTRTDSLTASWVVLIQKEIEGEGRTRRMKSGRHGGGDERFNDEYIVMFLFGEVMSE